MNSLLVRRMAILNMPSVGELPNGFTKFDWVQCEDVAAVDTGIVIDLRMAEERGWTLEGSFARTGELPKNWGDRQIFSRYTSGNNSGDTSIGRLDNKTNGYLSYIYGTRHNTSYGGKIESDIATIGTWHEFILGDNGEWGGKINLDGVDYSYTDARPSSDNTTTLKIFQGYPCRFARFKIYNNESLYADLVPAKREADEVIGFYDVVRDVFCTATVEDVTLSCGNGLEDFTV